MLALGLSQGARTRARRQRIALVRGDAMRLPGRRRIVDAATVAFGIRNVQRPEVGVRGASRVLRPGGRLAILEFGVPRIPGFAALYHWYSRTCCPLIGRLISGHAGAYTYLPASVGAFPPPAEFVDILSMPDLRRSRGPADLRDRLSLYGASRAPTAIGRLTLRCSSTVSYMPEARSRVIIALVGHLIHFDFDDRYRDEQSSAAPSPGARRVLSVDHRARHS